jgi:hypothetical protein
VTEAKAPGKTGKKRRRKRLRARLSRQQLRVGGVDLGEQRPEIRGRRLVGHRR